MVTALAPLEQTLLTAEEFFERHGSESHVDLVDGIVVRHPMPGSRHGSSASMLDRAIGRYLDEHDIGQTFTCDTFLKVKSNPDRMRGADFAYMSYEKYPADAELPDGPLPAIPELVAEVKSPSDSWTEVGIKVNDYLGAGVQIVLVLDPATKTVKRFDSEGERETLPTSGLLRFPDLLPGFECPVERLFRKV
jgi:Uma2 family endonuclease